MLTMLTNQETLDFAKLFISFGYDQNEIMMAMETVEKGYPLSKAMEIILSIRETQKKTKEDDSTDTMRVNPSTLACLPKGAVFTM